MPQKHFSVTMNLAAEEFLTEIQIKEILIYRILKGERGFDCPPCLEILTMEVREGIEDI